MVCVVQFIRLYNITNALMVGNIFVVVYFCICVLMG
jgi:hypothetical protein